MNRGVLFTVIFLLAMSFAFALDTSQYTSLDDLPAEVREKLPNNFSMDDIPDNLSEEYLRELADENNLSYDDYFGENVSEENIEVLCSLFLSRFDVQFTKLPGYVPFTYDVFNLYTFENQSIAYLRIQDKTIVEVGCFSSPNATYELFIKDFKTLTRIVSSDYVLDSYRHERKQGNIKLQGIRFGAMVKTVILNAAIGVMAIFG